MLCRTRLGNRYFPRFLRFLTPAGTAAKDHTICFVCPDFFGTQPMARRATNPWTNAAAGLVARLGADHRNHRLLADPWSRAAHSIVQSWRIIASQGRLAYTPPPKRRPATWKGAACRMKTDLKSRMRCRLMDPNTWRVWAAHVPRVNRRYIPRRKQ